MRRGPLPHHKLATTVNLLLHEVYGGMGGNGPSFLGWLAKLAATKGGRDDTEYHDPPGKKRLSFREHWARALSAAAALGDAGRLAARLARLATSRPRPRAPQNVDGAPAP